MSRGRCEPIQHSHSQYLLRDSEIVRLCDYASDVLRHEFGHALADRYLKALQKGALFRKAFGGAVVHGCGLRLLNLVILRTNFNIAMLTLPCRFVGGQCPWGFPCVTKRCWLGGYCCGNITRQTVCSA